MVARLSDRLGRGINLCFCEQSYKVVENSETAKENKKYVGRIDFVGRTSVVSNVVGE